MAIGTNPGGGALSGTLTKAAVAGVASFSANGLKIDKAGTGYTLTATDGSLTSATSTAFNINGPWYNNASWPYRKAITIDPTKVGAVRPVLYRFPAHPATLQPHSSSASHPQAQKAVEDYRTPKPRGPSQRLG